MNKFFVIFKNLKFKEKLFISYIIVSIIPIMILGSYSYSQAKSFLLQQSTQGLGDSIRQVGENINYRIKKYDSSINFIANNKGIQHIVTNNFSDYLILYGDLINQVDPVFNSVLSQNEDIEQITIFTKNNVPEYGSFIMAMSRLDKKTWLNSLPNNYKTVWCKEDNSLLGIRRLYNSTDDNLIYVRLNYNLVFDIFSNIKSNNFGAYITDSKNNLIFSMDKFENYELAVNKEDIVGKVEKNLKIKGVEYILIKNEIIDTDWTLYYYTPVSKISVNAVNIVSATILIIFVCFIILIFVILIFSSTFVKRINNLNMKMEIVEKGDMQLEVSSQSKDEIGQLTNRFGKMLGNINVLIKEVYQSSIIQKEAELKSLQAQINPHFLYNTLSLINWKAIEIEANDISDIVTNVSKYYRTVLNKGKNIISISNEIENTKAYIHIQLAMHDNSFDVEYFIDNEIFSFYMINIVLQPIVENAIHHGIDKKEDGRGMIRILGYLKGDTIELVVEDNGPGMHQKDAEDVLTKNSKGYGLKNVHDRIRIFFGESYGLKISSDKGIGTKVIISFPKYNGLDKLTSELENT